MTIEQKAKAYDEALELARDYYKANSKLDKEDENLILEDIFPELKESEDEKIRKTLVELVKCNERSGYTILNNIPTSSMLAWLEKQGEQKASGCNHLAELAEAEVTTSNGISEDMMSLRIEHTPLSTRVKKILGLFWLNWANVNAWTTGFYRTIKDVEFAIKMERDKDLRTIVKYYE